MTDEMEKLLSEQPLRAPSTRLDTRMAQLFPPRESTEAPKHDRSRFRIGNWWLPLGAAVAATIVLAVAPNPYTDTSPEPPLAVTSVDSPSPDVAPAKAPQPVTAEWTYLEPGDLVWMDEHGPMKPLRQRSVTQTQWIDDQDNVRMELTVPREQVILLSVPVD